jgi:hypothetical protein
VAVSLGSNGKSKAGLGGAIVLSFWDEVQDRIRIAVAYPGENGIKPDTWYSVDRTGLFFEVEATS